MRRVPAPAKTDVTSWSFTGADPSDWFNYGFNEEAWKAYCQKQKTLREEYQLQSKIKVCICTRALSSLVQLVHVKQRGEHIQVYEAGNDERREGHRGQGGGGGISLTNGGGQGGSPRPHDRRDDHGPPPPGHGPHPGWRPGMGPPRKIRYLCLCLEAVLGFLRRAIAYIDSSIH